MEGRVEGGYSSDIIMASYLSINMNIRFLWMNPISLNKIAYSTILIKVLQLINVSLKIMYRLCQSVVKIWTGDFSSIYRYRVFKKKVPTFVFSIFRLSKQIEMWFCTFFNSPAFVEFKNNNIFILGLKFEKLFTKK